MEKRWTFKETPNPKVVDELKQRINSSHLLTTLLVQRGIHSFEEAKHFFNPNYQDLHNPFLMTDMDKAVERIQRALANGERIMVYGDYDVDGTTSVALVYSYFHGFYSNMSYYIPDRYTEGYGISFQGIDSAEADGVSLVIALDCGIKAIDKIEYANKKGIDFIICDHHRPGNELPKALAVLDPKRDDCTYPYDELSGCGIGFKLIQAYSQKENIPIEKILDHLDLTAVSIACDIVPVTGENRIMAHYGLKSINENPRPGIEQLIKLSNKKEEIEISDLVFSIGPKINAAGRIEHGKKAVQLLTAFDNCVLEEVGDLIKNHNLTRKGLDKEITAEALEMIENDDFLRTANSTVLFHPDWHKGVIGIVASRVIEHYYRPTIILTENNGVVAGSARSVKGFDVYNAIEACSDHIIQFGGHKYAAGLTIEPSKIDSFRQKFEEVVSATLEPHMKTPEVLIDAEAQLSDFTMNFFTALQRMSPFGPKNMAPLFCIRNLKDSGYSRAVGEDGSHLKLSVFQEGNKKKQMDGIAFGMGDLAEKVKTGTFDMVCSLEKNVWQGQVRLQLMVKDIKFNR